MIGAQTKGRINTMASADLEFDARAPVLAEVDFTSEVVIAQARRDG